MQETTLENFPVKGFVSLNSSLGVCVLYICKSLAFGVSCIKGNMDLFHRSASIRF